MKNFSIACQGKEVMESVAKIESIMDADRRGMAFGGFDEEGNPTFVGEDKQWSGMGGGQMANYPDLFTSENEADAFTGYPYK